MSPTRPRTARVASSIPGHVRGGRAARVVADREALVGQAEDDLGGDDEGGQPDGVDLDAVDARAARLDRAVDLVQRPAERGPADGGQALGQLARGAARDVGLGRARVVDHLPLRQMARGQQGAGLGHRGGEGEVARRDRARAVLARPRVDRREVLAGQAGRADDHVDPALERGVRVAPGPRRAT